VSKIISTMAMIPPSDRLLGLLSAACDTAVTPAHSHDIGGGKIKVAAPGSSKNVISAAHGFQSNDEAEFLPSQVDDGIGTPHPTSSNNKTRRLTKNDGIYKNGGASGFSPAGVLRLAMTKMRKKR
jgi:hypothetical protein